MSRSIRTTVAAALALAMSACGAAPAAKAPEASPQAAPARVAPNKAADLSEVDALEQDLAGDEQSLRAELAQRDSQRLAVAEPAASAGEQEGRATKPSASHAEPAKAAPAGAPAPIRAGDDRAGGGAAADKKKDETESDCELACRAVASMRRSADRICEILSDGHARCVAARRRVADAERRISEAQCRCAGP